MINTKKIIFIKTFFNTKKFFKIIKNYKSVLDFGCGVGVYQNSRKKIYLYDKNKSVYKILENKYQHKKNFIIIKKPKYKNIDVLLLNSCLQYLSNKEFKIFVNKIQNNFKLIIFSDIPKFPRALEGIILIIKNPVRFLEFCNFFLNKNYYKLGFYYRRENEIIKNFKNYTYKKGKNLNNEDFTRYTLIFKKIKY